ncbi:hypothetical protein Tco_0293290, partial [Tanacetum coccineum]
MGYGDYVIGDSVISRVYYVEGLGHNLFFVGQFCDSDLEVAFRKHSCYVRDTDGVELLKGSRGSNLYTISVEDMMKSSWGRFVTAVKLNKGLKDSNFDQLYAYLKQHEPHSANTSQSDLGISPTENLIENLTNTLALLTQSTKTGPSLLLQLLMNKSCLAIDGCQLGKATAI